MRFSAVVSVLLLAACKSGDSDGDSDPGVDTDPTTGPGCSITGAFGAHWLCEPILLYDDSYELWTYALLQGSPDPDVERIELSIAGTGAPTTGTFDSTTGERWRLEVEDPSGAAWEANQDGGGSMSLVITELGNPITYTYGIEYHGTVATMELDAASTGADEPIHLHVELPIAE